MSRKRTIHLNSAQITNPQNNEQKMNGVVSNPKFWGGLLCSKVNNLYLYNGMPVENKTINY